jgi:hypothetical protein
MLLTPCSLCGRFEFTSLPYRAADTCDRFPVTDSVSSDPSWQQPGGLGIKHPRAYRPWQLGLAVALSLLVGMALGYGQKKPARRAGTLAATSATTAPSDSDSTKSTASGASPTTATTLDIQPVVTTAPAAAQAAQQLLFVSTTSGTKTTDAFKVAAGGWAVGWAYDCASTPGGTFKVTVVGTDGAPSAEDAVIGPTEVKANAVQHYTSVGERKLQVDTTCRWALKVTGIPG